MSNVIRLDINTPRGQESLAWVWAAEMVWATHNPKWRLLVTPEDSPADVDGILFREGTKVISAVLEIKCRSMSEAHLVGQFGNEWLITQDKLERGCAVARALRVPFVGWLYLYNEGVLLVQRIANDDGTMVVPHRKEMTETQATINGGSAYRMNTFISMAGARRYT